MSAGLHAIAESTGATVRRYLSKAPPPAMRSPPAPSEPPRVRPAVVPGVSLDSPFSGFTLFVKGQMDIVSPHGGISEPWELALITHRLFPSIASPSNPRSDTENTRTLFRFGMGGQGGRHPRVDINSNPIIKVRIP